MKKGNDSRDKARAMQHQFFPLQLRKVPNLNCFFDSIRRKTKVIAKSRSAAMRNASRFAVLLLLLLISTPLQTEAEVITLTPDTFSDKIKEKDTAWFVKFCVPWCKHCKNLGTMWDELGKTMEGEDEIEIGEVDCSVSKPVCTKVDIHSYPTFKLFYDGEEVAKYQGKRDVESLKAFALEEAEKASEKSLLDTDKEL